MNPDNQFIQDLKLGCLFTIIIAPIFYVMITYGGYPPADECANVIKNGTGYTRQKMLINNEPTYGNLRAWCVNNLDNWKNQLDQARDYQTVDYQF